MLCVPSAHGRGLGEWVSFILFPCSSRRTSWSHTSLPLATWYKAIRSHCLFLWDWTLTGDVISLGGGGVMRGVCVCAGRGVWEWGPGCGESC